MSSEIKVNKITTSSGSTLEFGGAGDTVSVGSGATVTGFGKVLQVVSTAKTDTWSSSLTSGAEADVTGLSLSITPSSTSSKILIMASVNGHNGAEGGLGVLITESGTMISPLPDSAGNKGNGKVHSNDIGLTNSEINTTTNFQILHSPSSTSALTYQVRIINYSTTTRTVYLNRPSGTVRIYGVSTITAMEIAG
jgi:hypothetical protein